MLNVSREETLQRWDDLPINIREALSSEENFDLIEKLGEVYTLRPEILTGLSIIVSNILHGFVHPEELQAELSSIASINNDLALKISAEIKTKIFDPLQPELNSIYQAPKTPTAQMKPVVISTPSAPVIKPPESIKPAIEETPTPVVAPFIMHKHEEELRPRAEEVATTGSPIRPVFYKAPNSTTSKESSSLSSKPIKARLELGVQEEARVKKPTISRTPSITARRVNYSEFKTKLDDPFAAQTKIENSESSTNKNSDQAKEADLKDLPL